MFFIVRKIPIRYDTNIITNINKTEPLSFFFIILPLRRSHGRMPQPTVSVKIQSKTTDQNIIAFRSVGNNSIVTIIHRDTPINSLVLSTGQDEGF
jgi:hypothetical protein